MLKIVHLRKIFKIKMISFINKSTKLEVSSIAIRLTYIIAMKALNQLYKSLLGYSFVKMNFYAIHLLTEHFIH